MMQIFYNTQSLYVNSTISRAITAKSLQPSAHTTYRAKHIQSQALTFWPTLSIDICSLIDVCASNQTIYRIGSQFRSKKFKLEKQKNLERNKNAILLIGSNALPREH
jgi:hypothetical protein